MKTEFQLEYSSKYPASATIRIIGQSPNHTPYVVIEDDNGSGSLFIKDKDLQRFAVNILKALKSEKLKP